MKNLIFDIQRFHRITNNENDIVITSNIGNFDDIVNAGSNVVINFVAEGGLIDNYGSNVIIKAGSGRGNRSIDSRSKANFVTIEGGKGKDEIRNRSSHSLILGVDGNDCIYNYRCYYSTIHGGAGHDIISNNGNSTNVIMIGGEGNDAISNNAIDSSDFMIDGGNGNDVIMNDGSNGTINGGEGNDKISSYGSYVLTEGGDGDDTISLGGISKSFYDTIIGGKGDDAIYNGTAHDKDVYFYNLGDGNDTINYFGANDTLMIANSDYTTIKDGSLVIVQVGEGSIILKGLGDNTPKIKTTSKTISFPTFDNITIPNFDNTSFPTNYLY